MSVYIYILERQSY